MRCFGQACLLLLLCVGGCVAFVVWVGNQPAPNVAGPGAGGPNAPPGGGTATAKPEPAKSEPKWLDVSKKEFFEQDGIVVMIGSYEIRKVDIEHLGQQATSDKEHGVITVGFANRNPAKKVDYSSWNEAIIHRPLIKDEHGNVYKLVDFGFGTKVHGSVKSATIRSDAPVADVIVFERPVTAATKLFISLPANAFGGNGEIRFTLPAKP